MKKTQSKQYPELQRLQGKVQYPVGIEEITVTNEDGTTETHYSYYNVPLVDRGDNISDKSVFAKKRYADLRRLSPIPYGYGSQDEQMEMQQESGFTAWQDHCQAVKNNWPK